MDNGVFYFVINYLKSIHINCLTVSGVIDDFSKIDLGLREVILGLSSEAETMDKASKLLDSKTIYHFTDRFRCNYTMFKLPNSDEYEVIGPILLNKMDKNGIYSLMSDLNIPFEAYEQLKEYYYSLPHICDKGWIFSLMHNLGKELYGEENVMIKYVNLGIEKELKSNKDDDKFNVTSDPILSMKILEDRYYYENELLSAVQHGNFNQVQSILETSGMMRFASRIEDEVQESKHLLIVLNTLLRRAVYQGGVHPLHINNLSNFHAVKINQILTTKEAESMYLFIIMNYCNLVKDYSLSSYSKPVQKIISTVDAAITEDLRLNTFAKDLFMNPSYLSALFKNEVGMTLTEYVNKKRLKYGTTLLEATNIPIQEIAVRCGIPDIHYFTRLFKREYSMTPREYRKKNIKK